MRSRAIRPMFRLAYLLLVASLSGCIWDTQLHTANFSGTLNDVVGRHDAYVTHDLALTPEIKAGDLAQSAFLAAEMNKTAVTADEIRAPLSAVADRHDSYVNGDPTVTPRQHRIFLRDTQVLRVLVGASTQPATGK